MEFIQNAKYDLISPSSMGVRITPVNRETVYSSDVFKMQATSAETNVLNVSASLGLSTLVLTTFVEDSPIAYFIKGELRKRNIQYMGKEVPQGGPWGYRHQFNIADSGFGKRGPRVTNDRAGEVGRTLNVKDFVLEKLFFQDKVRMIHISGLIAALSKETSQFCLELARTARRAGTRISFDLNYRASFWKGREEELSASFREIASLADILIGNEEDFQLALGLKGPDILGSGLALKMNGFKEMINLARKEFPNVSYFATTLREVKSANTHLWGALTYSDDWYYIEPQEIDVLDRIGGGDGFVGGLLYSILMGKPQEESTNIGWACGIMAVSTLNDYATPMDVEQIEAIVKGNARVKR